MSKKTQGINAFPCLHAKGMSLRLNENEANYILNSEFDTEVEQDAVV